MCFDFSGLFQFEKSIPSTDFLVEKLFFQVFKVLLHPIFDKDIYASRNSQEWPPPQIFSAQATLRARSKT